MTLYLDAVTGPSRLLPFIGDDDGGRFFHPYGPRERFAGATLAACGQFFHRPERIRDEEELHELALWWLGPDSGEAGRKSADGDSVRFADAGIVVMRSGETQCIVDAGPFGPFRGGHSHADTLSIAARTKGHDLLIDPGTFSYSGESPWRDRFRGTAAHNTVRIGGLDQAGPAGPFGWRNPPQVEIREWHTDGRADFLDAACRYRGFLHRRRVFFLKPELLFILDDVEGDQIEAEQFWHLGGAADERSPGCFGIGSAGTLLVSGEASELSQGGEFGWRSPAYGWKEASPLLISRQRGKGAVQFGAALVFSASFDGRLVVTNSGQETEMVLSGPLHIAVTFPNEGLPRC